MKSFLIKGGIVYDPLNGVEGEVIDIGLRNGVIVDPSSLDPRETIVVDARGMMVVPGGIDVHSHIAGPKVNTGRVMMVEDHYLTNIPGKMGLRSQTGRTVPNVYKIGYGYARLGYTTVVEAASPPLKTRHTHEELNSIPIIDKMTLILMDSNWIALDYISEGDLKGLAGYIAWLLHATKGYGVKIVDPGADLAWLYGKGYGIDLDTQLPEYNLTPREIILMLGEASTLLNLPHPIHVHCNRLGYPGNYSTTTRTLELSSKYSTGNKISMHITHVQFTGYKGSTWATLGSGGEEIARILRRQRNASVDLGQIIFGSVTTMTADAPFEHVLFHISRWKWAFADVEAETASGIVPYRYRRRNYVNTVQWTIGLEVALLTKDPWRTFITTDHPNAGPFTKYPRVIAWLMSRRAREEEMKKVNRRALKKTALPAVDEEFDFNDIIIATRAAPAKLLGLEDFKGHLGIGAQADIAIYNIDPGKVDPSRDWKIVEKALSRAEYVFKDGRIVVRGGRVVEETYGSTLYVKPEIPEDLSKTIVDKVREMFPYYYSIQYSNFIVDLSEIRKPREIPVKTLL